MNKKKEKNEFTTARKTIENNGRVRNVNKESYRNKKVLKGKSLFFICIYLLMSSQHPEIHHLFAAATYQHSFRGNSESSFVMLVRKASFAPDSNHR